MILGRLGRMAYINTLPVDWGILHGRLGNLVSLHRGTPTTLNSLLAQGSLDLSPVSSVAAAEHADEWLVLDGLCIGCRGPVGSVILQSDRPVEELNGKAISVTAASATAVRLLEILLSGHWKIEAELIPETPAVGSRLLIGDQALKTAHSHTSGFIYDLGAAWREYTGQDFVFGLWCVRSTFALANPEQTTALLHLLHMSHALARMNASAVVAEAARVTGLSESTTETYFEKLVYVLDDRLRNGLKHFLYLLGYQPDRLQVFEGGTLWMAKPGVCGGL